MQESDNRECAPKIQCPLRPTPAQKTSDSYRRAYNSAKIRNTPTLEQLVGPLAQNFSSMIENNSSLTIGCSPFNSKKAPGISVRDYLARLARYSRCSAESFLLAVVYIDRYFQERPKEFLCALNFHK